MITSSDAMWNKWKEVLEKHETRELIDPNIGRVFYSTSTFKLMKPLVGEFFQTLQGLDKIEMEGATMYILHIAPTTKGFWNHPKIVFKKLRMFSPSYNMMKERLDNKRKMPHMSLIVNRGGQPCELEGFQEGTQVHKCLHDGSYEGSGGGHLEVQDGERGQELCASRAHSIGVLQFHQGEDFKFEGEAHFGAVVMEHPKIIGWLEDNGWAQIHVKAKDHISFVLLDFMNIPGSTFEGTMSMLFDNPFLGSFLVHRFFEDSVQAINNSNLQSLFYDATYDGASTTNNLKSPWVLALWKTPPKKIFRPFL